MSHLDHIVRVKTKLNELGVTCPKYHRQLIDNAYVDAIVRAHFIYNPTYFVPNEEKDKYRDKLDCWNSVSPIGYELIWTGVLSFINLSLSSLTSLGRNYVKVTPVTNEGTVVLPCISELQEYKDLVSYLLQELRGCHE